MGALFIGYGPTWPYPGENVYAPAVSSDPVRSYAPFTPSTGNTAPSSQVPVMGVLAIAGVILLFEYLRHQKGR